MKHKLLASLYSFIFVAAIVLFPLQASAAPTISITSPTSGDNLGTSFTVEGTATANSTIQVYINNTLEATTTSNGSGNWSTTITNQTEGDKNIEARVSITPLVYVGGFTNANLYVFSSDTNTQISGSPYAAGAALGYFSTTSSGDYLYTTSPNIGASLYRVDTDTNTTTSLAIGGTSLVQPIVSPDGDRVYIADSGGNSIRVVDTSSFTEVETIDVGDTTASLAISPDGSTLYAASNSGGNLYVIDLGDKSFTTTALTGSGQVPDLQMNSTGTILYATVNTTPGTVSVIDTATNTETNSITIGNSPVGITILPDDSKVYAANSGTIPGTVSVIDTATNTVETTVNTGLLTYGVDATPDGSAVYAVSIGNIFDTGQDGGVWEIDTTTNTASEFFATDDGSIGPVAVGDYIVQQTASTSITATVTSASDASDNDGELADTGISFYGLPLLAVIVISSGLFIRRYQ